MREQDCIGKDEQDCKVKVEKDTKEDREVQKEGAKGRCKMERKTQRRHCTQRRKCSKKGKYNQKKGTLKCGMGAVTSHTHCA